ncbi:hypothetical protein RJE46_10875 [Cedecea neteri]|uniref:hypothetical protein n=1 Tax=Cedecea neteri TaxID=158822 RepID=UPI002892F531|nr:hypothetical protein [Cedecea neteri]WNJ81699.1 hypothetical protein RJE46_10875 [Cedecea neteri]
MLRIGQVENTAQNGKYTDGNVAGGVAATRLRAAAFNAIQEELANIVESAGMQLSVDDMTQVLTALKKLFLSRSNPFADIKSDGAAAVAAALSNLGLGTAAKRDVGTSASQLPDMSSFSYVNDGGSAYGIKFPSLNAGGAVMMQTAQVNLPVGITDITLPYAVPNAVISVVTSICNGATQPSNGTVFAAIITAANKIRFINWGTLGITVQYQAWCR